MAGARAGLPARLTLAIVSAAALGACGGSPAPGASTASPSAPRPSILLVTLDTTRADAIGPEARGIDTPSFNGPAARTSRRCVRATRATALRNRRHRRSWGGARRSWRAAARTSALSVDDARAAGGGGTGCDSERERDAGQHAADLSHDARLGWRRVDRQPPRRLA